MRNNALKRITTIFCALTGMTLCSVNAKTYYVDKGSAATSGDCLWTITINDPEQEHIPLNEKAFNEWFNSVKFTAGDIIKIAGGHYTYKQITEKDNEEPINDIPNGVTLAGSYDGTGSELRSTTEGAKAWDFTHPTILDGNHQKTVLSTKSNAEAETPYTYIDGVVVCNGKNNGITGSNVDGSAGIFIQGKVEVRNCIIRNCHSKANGAGVYMMSGRLINSQITGNTQTDNVKGGGGIYIDCRTNNLPSLIEDCVIESNTATAGAGIVLTGNRSIGIVNRCIIRNNNIPVSQIADGSAIKVTTAEHIINNCLIYNNSASEDASTTRFSAIYMEHGNLLNTTVCNNIGAIFLSKNVVACQNNVCWNNTNTAGENIIQINTVLTDKKITHNASCDDSGIFTAENNHILIDNKINEGVGNVNFIKPTSFTGYAAPENPLFAQLMEEMNHADWNLNNNSVLLDKGDDTAIPNQPEANFTKDLLSNPRIKNSGIDIGAIEFQGVGTMLEKQFVDAVLVSYQNGRILFSENINGYVTINSLNGVLIAQKEAREGMLEVDLKPGYYLINWNKNARIIVVR
ncbi:MAG: right-handed parallel beta-helix repeat-containing protein [Bacteroidales bacterium]